MDNDDPYNLVNAESGTIQSDLLWGAAEIGKAINRTERQVFHLWRTGAVKSIRKAGGKLVGSRGVMLRELRGDE